MKTGRGNRNSLDFENNSCCKEQTAVHTFLNRQQYALSWTDSSTHFPEPPPPQQINITDTQEETVYARENPVTNKKLFLGEFGNRYIGRRLHNSN